MSIGPKEREARIPIQDEAGVLPISAQSNATSQEVELYSATSEATVADLICEGGIEGIVTGEYMFKGNLGQVGYSSAEIVPYKALNSEGVESSELGFLRSVYWNEVPVVDKDGFYNFQEVNIESKNGSPQGELPTLNSNLPLSKNSKNDTAFELTLFRNIGERLFGPTIDSREGKIPRYYLDDNTPHPPHLVGEVDKNSKVYMVNNKECVAVKVNLRVPQLFETLQDDPNDQIGDRTPKGFKGKVFKSGEKVKRGFYDQEKGKTPQKFGSGDIKARKIKFSVFLRPVFDTRHFKVTTEKPERLFYNWQEEKTFEIFGRINEPYVKSLHIDFNKSEWGEAFSTLNNKNHKYFQGWEIKIVRLTPDSFNQFLKNESYVDSLVEVYDSKLRYPYASMVYSKFSAEFFQRIPHRAYDTKLLKVKIPNTYDPILRSYNEPLEYWDGCFKAKKEWTNNPAWCFYDLVTNNRYGLGDYIDAKYVDKWTLYEIAKYCDTLVPDGRGGVEPRFTLNHLITSREEAYKVVNDLASAFRSIVYYAFGNIYVSQDRPKDPIYLFTTSNVADGVFNYASSAKKARHTVAIIRYSDKNNLYKPAICYVEDQAGIQRYGIREIETSAIGCTSEGQAKRFGEWILKSEILETETVTFTAGMEGMYIRPGDIVSVYDEFRNDRKLSGRTLRVEKEAEEIIPVEYANTPSYLSERIGDTNLYPITGNAITIDKPLHFMPNQQYKLELLTPSNYYEPSQITPSNCVETITETEVPGETKTVKKFKELTDEESKNKPGYRDFNTRERGVTLFTVNDADGDGLEEGGNLSHFITDHEIAVDIGQGRFQVNFINSDKFFNDLEIGSTKIAPKKVQVVVDGVVVQSSDYLGSKYTKSSPDPDGRDNPHDPSAVVVGGDGYKEPATNGDLYGCLGFYRANGSNGGDFDAKIKADADTEIQSLLNGDTKIHDAPDGRGAPQEVSYSFEKAEGISSITIRVFHPITARSSSGIAGGGYQIALKQTHGTVDVEETISAKTIESITRNADNTDKALTSADFPEIRKNQIQTLHFSGYQAIAVTGDYHSEFSVNGSGIVTKIFFDKEVQASLDFANYAITGYDNSSVIADLSDFGNASSPNDLPISSYKESYENASGANLVWSIEPLSSDINKNRQYTLDQEFASGHAQEYKVINITEKQNSYDIMALEHVEAKYQEGSIGDGGGGTGPVDGPPEDVKEEDGTVIVGPGPEIPNGEPPIPKPNPQGACCTEEGSTETKVTNPDGSITVTIKQACEDSVYESNCDGEFHEGKTCEEVFADGGCTSTYVTPPPVSPIIDRITPLTLQFKFNFDLSSLSPSQGTVGVDGMGPEFRLKPLTDDDVFGEDPSGEGLAILAYYQAVLEDYVIGEYSDKTDLFGDTYLVSRNFIKGDNLEDYQADSSPIEVTLDDYCEYAAQDGDVFQKKLVPGYHGMIDHRGKRHQPVWNEEDTKKSCNPPGLNTEIFIWENSHSDTWSDSAENITESKGYWVAPPDEEYKLSIHKELYRYPGFLRDGDGNLVDQGGSIYIDKDETKYYAGNLEPGWKEKYEYDIRSFDTSELANPNAGLEKDGRVPYIKGESSDGEGNRFWNVNPAYYAASHEREIETKSISFKYADVANLNLCGNVFNYVSPKTTFKCSPYMLFKEGDNIQQIAENGKLSDYLVPGQYLYFTVLLERICTAECATQASFVYTFGINLTDDNIIPNGGGTCQAISNFSTATSQIYDTPMAFAPNINEDTIVYPSRVFSGEDISGDGQYYQLYLGGRQSTAANVDNYIQEASKLNAGEYIFVAPESQGLRSVANINPDKFDPNFVFFNGEYKDHATLVFGLDLDGNKITAEINENCEEGVVVAGDNRGVTTHTANPFRNLAPRDIPNDGNRRHPDPADAEFKAFKKEKKVRVETDDIFSHNLNTDTVATNSKFGPTR